MRLRCVEERVRVVILGDAGLAVTGRSFAGLERQGLSSAHFTDWRAWIMPSIMDRYCAAVKSAH